MKNRETDTTTLALLNLSIMIEPFLSNLDYLISKRLVKHSDKQSIGKIIKTLESLAIKNRNGTAGQNILGLYDAVYDVSKESEDNLPLLASKGFNDMAEVLSSLNPVQWAMCSELAKVIKSDPDAFFKHNNIEIKENL